MARKRSARPGGQGRPREVPFTIRDPAPAVPLAAVSTRDDPTRTQKLKGPMHPRPEAEEMAKRQAKLARRDIGPRSSSTAAPRLGEGSRAGPPAAEFTPVISVDSDTERPRSPHGGEHLPLPEVDIEERLRPVEGRGQQQLPGAGQETPVFVPRWDVRVDMSSRDPGSVGRKLIEGSLLPRDEAMLEDLLETYRGPEEFVDFCYGRMREVSV